MKILFYYCFVCIRSSNRTNNMEWDPTTAIIIHNKHMQLVNSVHISSEMFVGSHLNFTDWLIVRQSYIVSQWEPVIS